MKSNPIAQSLIPLSRNMEAFSFIPCPAWRVLLCALAGGASALLTIASEADLNASTNRWETLAKLSLEDILNTEITSVSKRPEKLFETSAAAFVIHGEDLRRTGARTFPEALRMAPGVNVAQIDSHSWGVSVRGFTDLFNDKLLVLMDGRSVFSPLTSGVNWDVQNTLLEDIERIEVIRGPGGTLWGANAVNGVVNILTKDARDTQGPYVTGGGGTIEKGLFGIRYGAQLEENLFARAYVHGFDRDHFSGGIDDSDMVQGGFRADWHLTESHLTLQGDYYVAHQGTRLRMPDLAAFDRASFKFPFVNQRYHSEGGNVLFRWTRQFSEESDLQLQTYYDRAERDIFGSDTVQNILDFELKHRFALPGRQNLMYGAGYRYLPDQVATGPVFGVDPVRRHSQVFNTFLQDEIDLVEDRLRLTLGTKLEHNDFTEWELQPNARLAWLPTSRQTLWGAVSRAVLIPGRFAFDQFTPTAFPGAVSRIPPPDGPLPGFVSVEVGGGRGLHAEEIIAYEIGYRIQATDRLSFDAALFYNDNSDFFIVGDVRPDLRRSTTNEVFLTVGAVNGGKAATYGFEVTSQWNVTDSWRLMGAYSFLKIDLDDVAATRSLFSEDRDPTSQVSLRSSWDLARGLALDFWGRYVDRLPGFRVNSYFDLDARLGWQPVENLEIALVGQNLLESKRHEFGEHLFFPTQVTPVARGGYLQVSYRY